MKNNACVAIMSFLVTLSCYGESSTLKKVDFLESMQWAFSKPTWKKRVRRRGLIKSLFTYKDLYDKNFIKEIGPDQQAKVPKIFHHIWVGPYTPPEVFKASQESIKKLHPDWEYRLWTDADVPSLNLRNQDLYDQSKNYGEKSDILRYEILEQFGGVYIDIDFICLKPFDPLSFYDFWTTILPLDCIQGGGAANGAIGSIPNHPILKECINSMRKTWYQQSHFKAILSKTGPAYFNNCLLRSIARDQKGVIVLPKSYFFPMSKSAGLVHRDGTAYSSEKVQSFVKPESYAIHYWSGSWVKARTKS